ncbi:alpha/beta hydrolase [Rhodospirillaceae bacterium SYSU D60014]|uniref:alpha/beta fold hydrolase n=1 Tax=Virgifigura deserti TaxID=2268457 RepID=UPI000E6703D8
MHRLDAGETGSVERSCSGASRGQGVNRRAILKGLAGAGLCFRPGLVFGEEDRRADVEMEATTTNGDVIIRYRTLGEGKPLVMLHGFTDSSESWAEMGYAAPLAAAGHRLILIDARGHGGSSRPQDPAAYSAWHRAGDVAAVLDAVGLERADLFGYSMGGWSALTFAGTFPNRVGRLIVGGAHPFGQSMAFYREAVAPGISNWIAILEHLGGPLSDAWKARILANDLAALQAAVAEDRPDISATLAGLERLCLFYVGTEDSLRAQIRRCAQLLPQAEILELPGCNHLTALLRTDLVLPRLLPFLSD